MDDALFSGCYIIVKNLIYNCILVLVALYVQLI